MRVLSEEHRRDAELRATAGDIVGVGGQRCRGRAEGDSEEGKEYRGHRRRRSGDERLWGSALPQPGQITTASVCPCLSCGYQVELPLTDIQTPPDPRCQNHPRYGNSEIAEIADFVSVVVARVQSLCAMATYGSIRVTEGEYLSVRMTGLCTVGIVGPSLKRSIAPCRYSAYQAASGACSACRLYSSSRKGIQQG